MRNSIFLTALTLLKIFNKHLNVVILLGMLLPVATLLYVGPVNALPTCGTITVSTYNYAGCTGGTLTIGASNINFGCKAGAKITATGAYGIQIVGESHVNVFGCKVTGATTAGIYVYQSSSNSITGNNATLDGSIGFYVVSSFGNNLAGNVAISNGAYGFELYETINNTLASNTATKNGNGFFIEVSNFNVLSDNTATSNSNNGFFFDVATYNTVTDNTANTNGNQGFILNSSTSSNLVVGNAARGNVLNAYNAATTNNFHTSLNPGIRTPYTGLQSP